MRALPGLVGYSQRFLWLLCILFPVICAPAYAQTPYVTSITVDNNTVIGQGYNGTDSFNLTINLSGTGGATVDLSSSVSGVFTNMPGSVNIGGTSLQVGPIHASQVGSDTIVTISAQAEGTTQIQTVQVTVKAILISSFSASPTSLYGDGDPDVVVLTASINYPSTTSQNIYVTNNNASVIPMPGQGAYLINLQPGTTSNSTPGSGPYTILAKNLVAANTSVTFTGNLNNSGSSVMTANVLVQPLTVTSLTLTPNFSKGGNSVTATATLNQPSADTQWVTLTDNNGNLIYFNNGNILVTGAGTNTGSLSFRTWQVTAETPITITASFNGTTANATLTLTGDAKSNTPGKDMTQGPCHCLGDDPALQGSLFDRSGNALLAHDDPVTTRGYPLACNISVSTQVVEANRPMANASFSYDIHVGTQTVYNGSCTGTTDWVVVDGDGTRLDFGPYNNGNGTPAPGTGIFSQLSVQQGSGYTLQGAGPPENIQEAGDFTYSFNTSGQLIQITDPAGNTQSVNYSNGLISSVKDNNSNKKITFTASNGHLTKVTENGSQASGGPVITMLSYTSGGSLSQITVKNDSLVIATEIAFTYNTDGSLKYVDRDNSTTNKLNFTYTPYTSTDCSTNVLLANENDTSSNTNISWGTSAPTAYGAAERIADTNNQSPAGTTYYDVDASGNLLQAILPTLTGATQATAYSYTYNSLSELLTSSDGTITDHYGYTSNGLLSTYTNNLNNIWTWNWNGADLSSYQDPVEASLGIEESWSYADSNLPHIPTSYTDAEGNQWGDTLNSYGQVTTVTPPTGSPSGPVTTTYDENTSDATYGYPLSAADSNNNQVTFDAYDPIGDLLQVSTYPITGNTTTKNSTQFTYDGAQRITKVTNPDNTTFQYSYTPVGKTVGTRYLQYTIDEAGTQYNFSYCDPCGALEGITGPAPLSGQSNWSLAWSYDTDHNLKTFTDANSHTTTYSYGSTDELTGVTYPDNSTLGFLYNNAALLRQVTNGSGDAISVSYDNAERPYQISFPTSGQATLSYYYQNDNSLDHFTDGIGTTTYSYWPNKLLKSVTYDYTASGLSAVQELDYSYNPDDSLQNLTWKSGGTVVCEWQYGYDAGGRLSSVSNSWNETSTFGYDGEDKLVSQSNQNGTSLSIAYAMPGAGQRGWPSSLTYKSGSTPFASYALTYDNGNNTVGNLTGVSELDGSTVSYSYDALYRLYTDSRTGANPTSHTYGLDLAGNLQTINGSTFASYDNANKIATIAGGSASYDGDGDLLSISGTSVPSGSFTWDDLSRLTSQTSTTTGVSITYGYDGMNHRVMMQVGSGVKTFYIYDGDLLLGEVQATSPNPTVTAAYTCGANGLVSERLVNANKSLWYAFGPQGETRQLTDSNGNVVDTYVYTAYGVPLATTGSDSNPFLFGGQVGYYTDINSSAGTILCGFRWYDPNLGRWLSRDPTGYMGGQNLYGYVGDNPTNHIDPLGWNQGLLPPDPITGKLRLPPGYDSHWKSGTDNRGPYVQDPDSGERYYPHSDDQWHWGHYDHGKPDDPDGPKPPSDKNISHYPKKCKKRKPNQRRRTRGDQSETDPWEHIPVPEPSDPSDKKSTWQNIPWGDVGTKAGIVISAGGLVLLTIGQPESAPVTLPLLGRLATQH